MLLKFSYIFHHAWGKFSNFMVFTFLENALNLGSFIQNISKWLLLVFSICYFNTKVAVKKILNCLVVSLFYPLIFLIYYKTTKTSILNDTYW